MPANVILYSTEGCHLCELAKGLLATYDAALPFEVVDIALKDDLFTLYGERIPVLKRHDNQHELGWPFDLNQLTEFLS